MMVESLLLALLQLLQQRQPVHPRHIDVGDHQIDVTIGLESSQGFDAVVGEQEADRAITDLMPKLLQDESLQVRLVVNDGSARSCGAFNAHIDLTAERPRNRSAL